MHKPNKRIALTLMFDTNYEQGDLDILIEHVGPDLQRVENAVWFEEKSDNVLNYQPEGSHWREIGPPYPWCHGNPTRLDCIKAGYCKRNPNCGD